MALLPAVSVDPLDEFQNAGSAAAAAVACTRQRQHSTVSLFSYVAVLQGCVCLLASIMSAPHAVRARVCPLLLLLLPLPLLLLLLLQACAARSLPRSCCRPCRWTSWTHRTRSMWKSESAPRHSVRVTHPDPSRPQGCSSGSCTFCHSSIPADTQGATPPLSWPQACCPDSPCLR